MKPYNQGNVDFFCGIYAVINACRYAGRKYHVFSFKEGCAFYQHMMQFLLDKGLFEEVLYHGSSFEIMQMYLEQARKYMYEHYRLRLFYKRPFTWMDVPVERATKVIAKYLTVPFPLSRFKLFDSYLYPHLDVGSCRWERGKKCSYVPREGIIFVKIVPEKPDKLSDDIDKN